MTLNNPNLTKALTNMKRKHKTNHRLRLDRDLIYPDDLFKEFADEAIDIIGVVWGKKD